MVKKKSNKKVRVLSDEEFQKEIDRRASVVKPLTEKEQTKEELKDFGSSAMLLVDGVGLMFQGAFKLVSGLFKMLVIALKFSFDGYKSLNRKADKKKKVSS